MYIMLGTGIGRGADTLVERRVADVGADGEPFQQHQAFSTCGARKELIDNIKLLVRCVSGLWGRHTCDGGGLSTG